MTKTNRPRGRPKKKLDPEAQKLADLKARKAGERVQREKRTAGMIDRAIELACDKIGEKRPWWKLSTDEKAQLHEANQTALEAAGLGALQDPKFMMAFTYAVVFLPKIIIEVMDYREKSQKSARPKPERRAEPDNRDIRQKGQGQDDSDLKDLPAKTAEKTPADL